MIGRVKRPLRKNPIQKAAKKPEVATNAVKVCAHEAEARPLLADATPVS